MWASLASRPSGSVDFKPFVTVHATMISHVQPRGRCIAGFNCQTATEETVATEQISFFPTLPDYVHFMRSNQTIKVFARETDMVLHWSKMPRLSSASSFAALRRK